MQMNRARSVLKISGREFLFRLLRARCARYLSRHRSRVGAPRLACFPGDDIGDALIASGVYEGVHLSAIFDGLLAADRDRLRTTVAIDVGANIGNHAFFFAERFLRVLAFEPNPISSRLLEASRLMNRAGCISVFPVALGATQGQAELHLSSSKNLGRSGFLPHLQDPEGQSFRVDVTVGDEVVSSEIGSDVVGLIKIDVEGSEDSVLEGLRETIRAHRPIILFEYHPRLGARRVFEVLEECGYSDFRAVSRREVGARFLPIRAFLRLAFGEEYFVSRIAWKDLEKTVDMVVALPKGAGAALRNGDSEGEVHVAE